MLLHTVALFMLAALDTAVAHVTLRYPPPRVLNGRLQNDYVGCMCGSSLIFSLFPLYAVLVAECGFHWLWCDACTTIEKTGIRVLPHCATGRGLFMGLVGGMRSCVPLPLAI